MKQTETIGERLAKKYKAKHSRTGSWNRANLEDEAAAMKLAAELRDTHYQVRSVAKEKNGNWEILYR